MKQKSNIKGKTIITLTNVLSQDQSLIYHWVFNKNDRTISFDKIFQLTLVNNVNTKRISDVNKKTHEVQI